MGEHCSMTERRADDATRDVADWLKCEYMLDHVGDEFDGVIASVTGFGFFVRLAEIHIDGLVHVSTLTNDYYQFDPLHQQLIGENFRRRYRLGDKVRVKVMGVNLDDRKDRLRDGGRAPQDHRQERQRDGAQAGRDQERRPRAPSATTNAKRKRAATTAIRQGRPCQTQQQTTEQKRATRPRVNLGPCLEPATRAEVVRGRWPGLFPPEPDSSEKRKNPEPCYRGSDFYGHRSGEGSHYCLCTSRCSVFHLRHDADGVRLRLCVSEREPTLCLDRYWGDRLPFYWSLRGL